MLDPSTPPGKLMSALRQHLKQRGLSYRDVASQLRVSENTIKRYFSGRGVTIDVLQRLAEVVELDLLSLVQQAQDHVGVRRGLNAAQLAALSERGPATMVYMLISSGWTVSQLVREFDLADQIDAVLHKLEGLGLIHRLPGRGLRLLVKPEFEGGGGYGQLLELARDRAQQVLRETDLRREECEWAICPVRLSAESIAEMRRLIERFQSELRALERRDLSRSTDYTQWYSALVVARPISRKSFQPQSVECADA